MMTYEHQYRKLLAGCRLSLVQATYGVCVWYKKLLYLPFSMSEGRRLASGSYDSFTSRRVE